MSLKKVLFKKYGILIKESESDYYKYLAERSDIKYDYVNILQEFSENCTTRYFKKNKIKEISKELLLNEMNRGKHTPTGKGTSPSNGKGSHGNITTPQIIQDKHGVHVEETVDTMSGKDSIYLEDEDKNNVYIEMDSDYMPIFRNNIITKNINK